MGSAVGGYDESVPAFRAGEGGGAVSRQPLIVRVYSSVALDSLAFSRGFLKNIAVGVGGGGGVLCPNRPLSLIHSRSLLLITGKCFRRHEIARFFFFNPLILVFTFLRLNLCFPPFSPFIIIYYFPLFLLFCLCSPYFLQKFPSVFVHCLLVSLQGCGEDMASNGLLPQIVLGPVASGVADADPRVRQAGLACLSQMAEDFGDWDGSEGGDGKGQESEGEGSFQGKFHAQVCRVWVCPYSIARNRAIRSQVYSPALPS